MTRCTYGKHCPRRVRWIVGEYRYCSYHWHWTLMCGCESHRRARVA